MDESAPKASRIPISRVRRVTQRIYDGMNAELRARGDGASYTLLGVEVTEAPGAAAAADALYDLRPDGTFTLRFQLPDGVQELPCVALSADGISERTITPVVRRQTTSSERELTPNPGDAS